MRFVTFFGLAAGLAEDTWSLRDRLWPDPAPTAATVEDIAEHSPAESPYLGGWGPERAVFSVATPAPYAVLNSIVDNPAHGDERNFTQVRQAEGSNATYADSLAVEPGDTLVVFVWVSISGADNLASDPATLHGTGALTSLANTSPSTASIYTELSADNASSVWDGALVVSAAPIELQFVAGSAILHTNGGDLAVEDLDPGPATLGFGALDGKIPLGWDDQGNYLGSGHLTFRVRVQSPEA